MIMLAEVVGTYCLARNEKNDDARRTLLDTCWGENGVYEDPMGVVPPGRAALHARIGQFHQAYLGAKIVATSKPDNHHGKIRKMVTADGAFAIDGRDFGELNAAGRIVHIVGIFGPPLPL